MFSESLIEELDRLLKDNRERIIVAVDGGSASGKTTLADSIRKMYNAAVFHMDDFFLQPDQRTAERLAEPGGNVDRERFESEVLKPLSEGRDVFYRPYDCTKKCITQGSIITPKRLNIIEGAYSLHPELRKYYDLKVFVDIDPGCQRERILRRNGDKWGQRFFEEWIPLEQRYFDALAPRECSDLTIRVENIDQE